MQPPLNGRARVTNPKFVEERPRIPATGLGQGFDSVRTEIPPNCAQEDSGRSSGQVDSLLLDASF